MNHFENIGYQRRIRKLEKQKRAYESKYEGNVSFQFVKTINMYILFFLQAEILNVNETALNEAEKTYSSYMDEWLQNTVPFATFEQLNKQHQEIQEITKNDLNNHLKGIDEFKQPFKDRLHLVTYYTMTFIYSLNLNNCYHQQSTQDQFLSVVVPKNESKEKEEKARSEKIQLETELEKERLEKEQAQKKAAQVELAKEVVGLLKGPTEVATRMAMDSLQSGRERDDDYGPFGYVGFLVYKIYRRMF